MPKKKGRHQRKKWLPSWYAVLRVSRFSTTAQLGAFLTDAGLLQDGYPSPKAFATNTARVHGGRIEWHRGRLTNALQSGKAYLTRRLRWTKRSREDGGVSAVLAERDRLKGG